MKEWEPDGKHPGIFQIFETLEDFERKARSDLTRLIPHLLPKPLHARTAPLAALPAEGLLSSYLAWLLRRHNTLELRGIRRAGQSPTVPLERVFVALKGDAANPYERAESRRLMEKEWEEWLIQHGQHDISREEARALRLRFIASSPLMPALEARDRPHLFARESTSVTLGEGFRRQRWLVVLGDPGSGKTTLVRWLTRNLAQGLHEGRERVIVPAYQVDPNAEEDAPPIDLGPARLPVLLRVADFAQALAKARRDNSTLLLADYLGHHPWLGDVPTYGADHPTRRGERLPSKELNLLIKDYLKRGQAVIFLDGLDEIAEVDYREQVARAIETFIRDWISTPDGLSPLDYTFSPLKLLKPDEPVMSGGNQIFLTSRIAGYHAAPLNGRLTHVTIEPMQDAAIDRYCEVWTQAVNELLADPADSSEEIKKRATEEAESLKAMIHDANRPGVQELASNPLLLAMLAQLHRSSEARLPEQRVRLYQIAVENLVGTWRDSDLTEDEVVHVLAPLAEHIHERYSTGLIEKSEARGIITKHLAAYHDVKEPVPASFRKRVDDFLEVLEERVGLLAARGESLYGFLHLSFQEYLAARYLVRDPTTAKEELLKRIGNPRWREPIRLAIGYLNMTWGPESRERLLQELLEADSLLGDLIPQHTLVVASALPELVHTPPKVAGEVTSRLLKVYGDRKGSGRFTALRTRIEETLVDLRRGNTLQLVDTVLVNILQSAQQQPEIALSAASLILRHEWFTHALAGALLHALVIDEEEWGWPVDQALRSMVASHSALFPLAQLPLRRALTQKPALVAFIIHHTDWLQLIVTLYGGLDDHLRFTPERIHRDSTLTALFLNALDSARAPATLIPDLWHIWSTSADALSQADALVALTILREDTISPLEAAFANATNQATAEAALRRLSSSINGLLYTEADIIGDIVQIAAAIAPLLDQRKRYEMLSKVLNSVSILVENGHVSYWNTIISALIPHLSAYNDLLEQLFITGENLLRHDANTDAYETLTPLLACLEVHPGFAARLLVAALYIPIYKKTYASFRYSVYESPLLLFYNQLLPFVEESDREALLHQMLTLVEKLLQLNRREDYYEFFWWTAMLKQSMRHIVSYPNLLSWTMQIIQSFSYGVQDNRQLLVESLQAIQPFLQEEQMQEALNVAFENMLSPSKHEQLSVLNSLSTLFVAFPELLQEEKIQASLHTFFETIEAELSLIDPLNGVLALTQLAPSLTPYPDLLQKTYALYQAFCKLRPLKMRPDLLKTSGSSIRTDRGSMSYSTPQRDRLFRKRSCRSPGTYVPGAFPGSQDSTDLETSSGSFTTRRCCRCRILAADLRKRGRGCTGSNVHSQVYAAHVAEGVGGAGAQDTSQRCNGTHFLASNTFAVTELRQIFPTILKRTARCNTSPGICRERASAVFCDKGGKPLEGAGMGDHPTRSFTSLCCGCANCLYRVGPSSDGDE